MDVGKAVITALRTKCQPLVIEAQQVQYCRMQVVHMALLINRAKPKLICLADGVPGLDPTASHPH